MDRLLARLERRFGDLHIPNLTLWLVGIQALALVLELAKPGSLDRMVLDPARVLQGEYWRLFTYVFLPPSTSLLWAILGLMVLHSIGTALEGRWGGFKYQFFWLLGMVLTSSAAMLLGVSATNFYLTMSLFLAFATLWPDYEFLLIVVPVKAKWLALLDAALLAYIAYRAPGMAMLMPVVAVANYLLFFAGDLVDLLRGRARQAARQATVKPQWQAAQAPMARRQCKVCGVTDEDPRAEFRICTCEKCGGKPTELCLTHIGNH
ncbi:MAG: hypothetical protein AB2A00_40730 [Myxococcota bacterium]